MFVDLLKGELSDKESRYEFMRLLVSGDLERSLYLSQSILNRFVEHLDVPIISSNDGVHFMNRVSLEQSPGLYSRNLALTRLVHSPICYGETLIQNNIDECLNLSRQDFEIGGQKCSSRIKQVAEAYFAGIKDYLSIEF